MVQEPPKPETDAERALLARIGERGWDAVHIASADDHPPHSYTVGIAAKLGAPELIVFGLPEPSAELLFSTYVRELKMGGLITSGRAYRTFLDGLTVQFLDLDPAEAALRQTHMPLAFWFSNGEEVPVMQLVWPDAENRMPWDPEFDSRLHAYQPVLGATPEHE
jgi:hypothetical protein